MKNAAIKMLDVEVTALGAPMLLHPVLIVDDEEVTLIDSVFPCQFRQLEQAMEAVGVSPKQISRVVLTHQDYDHIGAMPELLKIRGDLQVYAHPVEREYLEGRKSYLKLTPERIAARLQATPEEKRAAISAMFDAVPTFRVGCAVNDGDLLPFHGGIRVIHTPGHTPGHICLFLEAQRALIPGDELRVDKGSLVGPALEHTPNMAEALQSMKKLFDLEIEQVYAFHGGHYSGDIPGLIRTLAAG
jgi:glyoxylase-like metal-dependent hydrolase (beta-lactamase superfamily II)